MVLQKQTVNMSFELGIDTKTNPKLVKGKLLELQNAQVNNKQIEKTTGYVRLARKDQIDTNAFKALTNFNDNLLVAHNDRVSIYDSLSDSLSDRGNFSYVHHDTFTIKTGINTLPALSQVLSGIDLDYITTINQSDNGIFLTVFDSEKNIEIFKVDLKILSATIAPLAVCATETGVYIYATNTTLKTQLNEIFIDYTTAVVQSNTIITTDFVWGDFQDRSVFCKYFNKKLYLLVKEGASAALANTTVIVRDTFFQQLYRITNIIPVDSSSDSFTKFSFCSTVATDLNLFIIAASDTVFAYDMTSYSLKYTFKLPVSDPKTAPFYSCVYVQNTREIVLARSRWRNDQTTSSTCSFPYINKINLDFGGFTKSGEDLDPRYDPTMLYNTCLSSDLFTNGNKAFFNVQYIALPTSSNPNIVPIQERRVYNFVLDEDYCIIDTVINQTGIRQIYRVSGVDYICPSQIVPDYKNNLYPVTFYNESRLTIQNKQFTYSYELTAHRFDNDITAPFFSWQRGLSVYMGVGKLFQFSTKRLSEQGFSDYPQIHLALSGTGTGSLDLTKSYEYTACYEWTNGKGEVFESATAIAKTSPYSATAKSIEIVVTPPPWFTQKQLTGEAQTQYVKIYRTDADGNVFNLLTKIIHQYFTIANLTFIDTGSADISQAELLYTSGGVLDNYPAPSSIVTTLHANRLFSVPSDDVNAVYYSKPYQPGVGVGYSPYLYFNVEPRGGKITELASLDDKLLIFKRDYIYVVSGDGADATGNNINLSFPELVNSPVGCSEPNSIIRTPDGIMFKSLKGIYILDRSLAVSYIGADVEKYNKETIVNSALLLNQNKVKFITKEGSILVYDYYYQTWSTENNLPSVSCAIYNASFVTLLQNGKIYLQKQDYYKRESSNYSVLIQTGWLSFSKLQDYKRIYEMLFLGDLKGEHVIRVSISYDYVDTVRDYVYFDPKQSLGIKNSYGIGSYGEILPYGGDFTSLYQFRLKFPRQKVQAISLTFEDVFDNIGSETGNSFAISDIQFVVGLKSGNFKVGRSQMVG